MRRNLMPWMSKLSEEDRRNIWLWFTFGQKGHRFANWAERPDPGFAKIALLNLDAVLSAAQSYYIKAQYLTPKHSSTGVTYYKLLAPPSYSKEGSDGRRQQTAPTG